MPQLDILIAFPQIIWLIISFTLLYFTLTFYFLPLFFKSIKSKKLFISINNLDNLRIIEEISLQQKKNLFLLNSNFKLLKKKIFILHYMKNYSFTSLLLLILSSSKQVISYCNNSLLDSITFYPDHLNLKKHKKS